MYKKGISVIIPCYNREDTIKECIESILKQDYAGDVEVIVSDDGSTDHSFEIIESFGDQVILHRKPLDCKDQGVSGTRNRGFKVASNEYVCFLDSDDYYLPGFLKEMSGALDSNPDAGYAFCRCKKEIRDEGGRSVMEDWTRPKLSVLDKEYHALYRAFNIHTNTILIRRTVLDQAGLFDVTLSNVEDTDMWMRVSECSKGFFVDIYGAVYRINHSGEQLTYNSQKTIHDCMKRVYAKALARFIVSESKDRLRLLLIVRILLYMKTTQKVGLIFTMQRFAVVNVQLLYFFPKTFWRYLSRI